VSILHGPIADPKGTASGKGIPGHDAFGKTGTNDRKVSSAFLGGTPSLVADVWHGMPDQDVPGAGFGADVPNGIWRGFMVPALRGTPDSPFPAPGPACDAPGKFVDPVLGRTIDVPPPAPPPGPDTGPPPPAPGPNKGDDKGGDRRPGGGGGRGGGRGGD
jgi:membrane peptidoglycan carboxypeptidase